MTQSDIDLIREALKQGCKFTRYKLDDVLEALSRIEAATHELVDAADDVLYDCCMNPEPCGNPQHDRPKNAIAKIKDAEC